MEFVSLPIYDSFSVYQTSTAKIPVIEKHLKNNKKPFCVFQSKDKTRYLFILFHYDKENGYSCSGVVVHENIVVNIYIIGDKVQDILEGCGSYHTGFQSMLIQFTSKHIYNREWCMLLLQNTMKESMYSLAETVYEFVYS